MSIVLRYIYWSAELLGRIGGLLGSNPHFDYMRRIYRGAYWKKRLAAFGEMSHVYPTVVIMCPERVRIGNRVNIIDFVHIWGGGGVQIGNNVMIGTHAIITSQSHDKYVEPFCNSNVNRPVVIEDGCWIGSGAILLPGVTIGRGSLVGAQSVVTHDVEPHSIVTGVPARTIERLSE
jgi:acetyltransferase-like isoleucine patch superfamily enzyme